MQLGQMPIKHMAEQAPDAVALAKSTNAIQINMGLRSRRCMNSYFYYSRELLVPRVLPLLYEIFLVTRHAKVS